MKYTLKFRIWHWLNAIVIFGLLGTVFLRKTFLSYKTNAEILVIKLSEIGVDLTIDDAKIVAKAIRNVMWEWHIIFGYALAFLVVYRIFLFFIDQSKRESFASLDLHKKGVKALYYLLYISLFILSVSGFVIYFYQNLGISKEFAHTIKEIHELLAYVVIFFVPLHIAGVFIADATKESGIISTMVNGKTKDNF